MAEKVRVNMLMPAELKDYLASEGEKLGLNFTTMVIIACMEYRKTQQSVEMGSLMKSLMSSDAEDMLMARGEQIRRMLTNE